MVFAASMAVSILQPARKEPVRKEVILTAAIRAWLFAIFRSQRADCSRNSHARQRQSGGTTRRHAQLQSWPREVSTRADGRALRPTLQWEPVACRIIA